MVIMFINGYHGFISPVGVGMLTHGVFTVIAFAYLLSIALCVLTIVGRWFTYRKMGMPGWKSIIPFYNDYVLADTVSDDGIAAWLVLCDAVCCLTTVMLSDITSGSMAEDILAFLAMVSGIAAVVLTCVVYHRVSQGFGHDAGYTVGLVLLPVVFFPILGFSNNEAFDATRIPSDSDSPKPSAPAGDSKDGSAE